MIFTILVSGVVMTSSAVIGYFYGLYDMGKWMRKHYDIKEKDS